MVLSSVHAQDGICGIGVRAFVEIKSNPHEEKE